jgi:hypothetical protein
MRIVIANSLRSFFVVFFKSLAPVTVMTAIGLIAAVLYGIPATGIGPIIVCGVVGVLGLATIVVQLRQTLQRIRREEELYQTAKCLFDVMPEDWKDAVKKISLEGGVKQDIVSDYNKFRRCGFVVDMGAGLFLSAHFAPIIPRLVSEWEAQKKKAAGSDRSP